MYRTYNFRPASPPTQCIVLPGAIAKGLSPIKIKPQSKHTLDNHGLMQQLSTIPSRNKRMSKGSSHKRGGFKEYTFILPSVKSDKNNQCIFTPMIQLLGARHQKAGTQRGSSLYSIYHSRSGPGLHHSRSAEAFRAPSRVSTYNLTPSVSAMSNLKTTDHYTHWYENKSCNSRISSGNLKDMGNIEVPNLYTTVTPKSFLPPSPLRTKQFVMPLKLQQLEPQKKPPSSDLTVTFVHRKLGDNKPNCTRNSGVSGATKQSKNSSASSTKQQGTCKADQGPGDQYPDPLDGAPLAFINRLAEMTAHQSDTVRFERTKKGKSRTRVANP